MQMPLCPFMPSLCLRRRIDSDRPKGVRGIFKFGYHYFHGYYTIISLIFKISHLSWDRITPLVEVYLVHLGDY